MKVKVWGARGSVPAPGPETTRYGGNTSCVQVTLGDGTEIVLDAGTGIRNLGISLPPGECRLQILLTHLHLDHIQGLMFFAPAFDPHTDLVIWGPTAEDASLEERIARYISAPLTPVEVRELPCHLSFRDSPTTEWQVGSATVQAAAVTHRGPTLGYRITDGGKSLCYIPDHEPALGSSLADLEEEWISGFGLAQGADLLIHDCQYADDEYPSHLGWGHSGMTDALTFARRTEVDRVLLFHHDPLHSDDYLDAFSGAAHSAWAAMGGQADRLELAVERRELELAPAAAAEAS